VAAIADAGLQNLTPSQRRFLVCFAACASIQQAAKWAKIHRQNHYDWLEESSDYKLAFEKVKPQAYQLLEDEAVRRAREGVTKAVRYKGKIVGYDTEYSDSLLQFLLKGAMPEKYRERIDQRLSTPDGKPLLTLATFDAIVAAAEHESEKP
jgi:hypothetical protein